MPSPPRSQPGSSGQSPPKAARTEKQKAAARQNGARSRGPVTPAGKTVASRNAYKHGLFVRRIADWTETPENRDAVLQLIDQFTEEYDPQTAAERLLIEELADERL